ncbi:MAG TPA: GMC family oxidoreductase N-terminal domain-containing protein, partial [Methylomirabilota bacterium]|nr:GMC family oxidoreductase N-terminal domain-containing protein [Methylomirabilota bacterium]
MIEEADTVVVGAGSAGCVVAERLSRDGRHRVAVIEAGPSDRSFWVQVPLGYGRTFYDPRVNWMYRTEPDPGLGGRADYWPRGKVVGGSGSINAMLWVRGDPSDYDDWAAAGNLGWSHAEVLPTFKAIEHNEACADDHRAVGGPMHVTDLQHRLHPLARRFLAAAGDIGLPACRDFNGASQEGVGVYQINTRNGWRHSSAKAYLRPALRRHNLVVLTGATVVRIVLEGERAVGVEIRRSGETRIVRARCEVVLSAG